MKTVDLIIPVYNEEESLPLFYEETQIRKIKILQTVRDAALIAQPVLRTGPCGIRGPG